MKKILIIGATSAIAQACARHWASENAEFFLVGRNQEKLNQTADDLKARTSQTVTSYTLDMNHFEQFSTMLDACYTQLSQIDIALVAHGTLPNQPDCEQNAALAVKEFSTNAVSVIALLTELANRVEMQPTGTIAVISSVAGDRGRASNYLYGSAKAAVSTFCAGLQARLFKSNIHLLMIKPGFVNTPMTQGLPLPERLVTSPERVAKDIGAAIKNRKNTLYTPWFWRWIMLIICCIPTFIFKRLKL